MVSRRAFLSLVAGSMSASRVALAPQEACKVALYANVVSDLTHSRWHGYCRTPPRSCSSQALPPWRTCARISPLPTSTLAARSREEASHVLQHIDLADPQSSRRLR